MDSLICKPEGFSSRNYSGNYLRKTSLKSKRKKLRGPTERNLIGELEHLYLRTVKLMVEKDKAVIQLTQSYETKYRKVFEKRFNILQRYRKKFQDELKFIKDNKMYNFWMNVLKNSALGLATKRDEQILVHLIDIRSVLTYAPEMKFVLEFYFDPNPFFDNKLLTKTFVINCDLDKKKPFSYKGPSIVRCYGCDIMWKDPNHPNREFDFLNMFSPAVLSECVRINQFIETIATLENDFENGLYIQQNVIPKAILLFLEAEDHENSDST